MKINKLVSTIGLGSVLSAALVLPAASTTIMMTNAVGSCQAALPAYDASLRKRPLGIINEGTQGSFVTCSPASFANRVDLRGQQYLFVNVNPTGVAIVNCTGVNGLGGSNFAPVYTTMSAIVPAGYSRRMEFFPGPGAFDPAVPMNVSCLLPPGTGVASISTHVTL